MFNILPRYIKELTPISGNRNTFGENTFSILYNELTFEQKLKVAVDLVRQSMLYCKIPNPQIEMIDLNGDSYTACCILKDYLIQNNLGTHHTVCFVEGKRYETINMPSNHFILLVSDCNDNWFQLDPSPMVGYKCGQVESYSNKLYKICLPIEDKKEEYLKEIRQSIFQAKFLQQDSVSRAYEMAYEMMDKYNLFSGYYEMLCLMTGNLKQRINIEKIKTINKPMLEHELEYLTSQLIELQKTNVSVKRQLSLIQEIHRVKIDLGYSSEKKIFINGKIINISNLTPRLFYSWKLNTVMIKPSSFYINKDEEFAKIMQGEKKMSNNYFSNMGDISEYGISLMKFFHPDGYKYCDEMNGICNIFLVNEPADILLNRKKEIRKEYASLYEGKTVKWFNGKKIKWTCLGMNMVHSSDNSCEACCNFQSIFPESQLMTRFMYPNPKLIF